jgi:6-pyruvoyltetrahydropterin/6-carboxytetrahydropterin synthase
MTTDIDRPHELAVTRDFIAQHFLTVPDPGPEGEVHSHHFAVEARFAGPSLDEYGYLLDIDDVNSVLDDLEARYRDTLLNDLPEFDGKNPSVERFARLFGDRIETALEDTDSMQLTVRIWEDESAWASHRRLLDE